MAPSSALGSSSRFSSRGFTLVEVAIAIAIIAVAFVSLLALLPAGNTAFRRSMDMQIAQQIASRIITDAQQVDFDVLVDRDGMNGVGDAVGDTFRAPRRALSAVRYFDDQGRELVPGTPGGALPAAQRQKVLYHVNTRIMPRAPLPSDTQKAKDLEQFYRSADGPREALAMVTIQVAHNPGNLDLTLSPDPAGDMNKPLRNLWIADAKQAAVEMFTYSAYIGRN